MSYILDALRKADAQRARDPVRGIHAQPLRGSGSLQPDRGLRPWFWVAAAAAVAATGWAAWFMFRDGGEVKVVAPPPQVAIVQPPIVLQAPAVQVPAVQAPVPAPSPKPAPVVGNAIQPPPVVSPPPTAAQVAAATPPGWPPTGGDPRNTSRPMPRGRPNMGNGSAGEPPPPVAPAAPAAVQAPPVIQPDASTAPATPPAPMAGPRVGANVAGPVVATPPVTGLPPDAPKLAINGGVYSTNRAQRMLIVNGQVHNEGSEIAAGVVLEEIRAKTAVLRFRGARYTVSY